MTAASTGERPRLEQLRPPLAVEDAAADRARPPARREADAAAGTPAAS